MTKKKKDLLEKHLWRETYLTRGEVNLILNDPKNIRTESLGLGNNDDEDKVRRIINLYL